MIKSLVLLLLRAYKLVLSPLLESMFGHACRYSPTCSEYAYTVVKKEGVTKGVPKAIKRFLSCNPWSNPAKVLK